MKIVLNALGLLFLLLLAGACNTSGSEDDKVDEMEPKVENVAFPDWLPDANLYEVNVRQYTPEGTFAAFEPYVEHLDDMGVDIVWFMPVYPNSETKKKGPIPSYYAISDFQAINPRYGTMEEFKALVKKIQGRGIKVIMDWVANHTGWDHPWLEEHPEYYMRNEAGEITEPLNEDGTSKGWSDVADLDYSNPELRRTMIDAMKFWVEEVGVDGFRCDVAYEVPDDFWKEAISELNELKPLFWLAESDQPSHRNEVGFHANYAWSLHHMMNAIARGEQNARDVGTWLETEPARYDKGFYIQFLTNHDENHKASIPERMGEGDEAFAVLAFTIEGMPLIYSGQEAGNPKALEEFDKDEIVWADMSKIEFYKELLELKHENPALWNGKFGGKAQRIETTHDQAVFAFMREKADNRVVVVVNLTGEPQEISLKGDAYTGEYTNVFANRSIILTEDMKVQLNPWDYLVLKK